MLRELQEISESKVSSTNGDDVGGWGGCVRERLLERAGQLKGGMGTTEIDILKDK